MPAALTDTAKRIRNIAIILAAAVAVIFVTSYVMLERFIFVPEKLPRDFDFRLPENAQELFIDTSDGETINAILFRAPEPKGVALYFHGNAGSLSSWQFVSDDIVPLGFDVLVIDYRGYGKSTGKISEKGLYLDAEASFDKLTSLGYEKDGIVVYGRSLGTGVAFDLAGQRKAGALVLESPFTSMPDLVSAFFPIPLPGLIISYKFENLEKAPKVTIPTLVLHGDSDELIPFGQGRRIFDALTVKKKTLAVIEGGGHNNLSEFPEYHRAVKNFLDEL
ncbi:MAG: alpha/beta hydrolase [Pseudomonadota bacterium]